MVKLSTYLRVNLPTICKNWQDEYIRLQYDNELQKYINAKKKRIDHIIFNMWVQDDIGIETGKMKTEQYLIKKIKDNG